jgi:hypothetical protein
MGGEKLTYALVGVLWTAIILGMTAAPYWLVHAVIVVGFAICAMLVPDTIERVRKIRNRNVDGGSDGDRPDPGEPDGRR